MDVRSATCIRSADVFVPSTAPVRDDRAADADPAIGAVGSRRSAEDCPPIYVKRDDLMSIGGGGNKLRKLEFLIGEALHRAATRSSPRAHGNRTMRD